MQNLTLGCLMSRTITLLFLSIATLAVANVASAQATTEYYPIQKGNTWDYKFGSESIQLKITDVTEDGTAVLDTFRGTVKIATESILVKEDGVYRTHMSGTAINPPIKILPLKDKQPIADGAVWEVKCELGPTKLEGNGKATSEKVEVPAGDFDTAVVDFTVEDVNLGIKTTVRSWYAPKFGIVKINIKLLGNDTTFELEKFTPGE